MHAPESLFPACALLAPRVEPIEINERNIRLFVEIERAMERRALRRPIDYAARQFTLLLAVARREKVTLGEIEDVWFREDPDWFDAVDQWRRRQDATKRTRSLALA